MDMGFSCRKNAFLPGVHKIGAAISGPKITGKFFYGREDFSDQACDQKLNRANRYENEMVSTYRDLNCPGASPISRVN